MVAHVEPYGARPMPRAGMHHDSMSTFATRLVVSLTRFVCGSWFPDARTCSSKLCHSWQCITPAAQQCGPSSSCAPFTLITELLLGTPTSFLPTHYRPSICLAGGGGGMEAPYASTSGRYPPSAAEFSHVRRGLTLFWLGAHRAYTPSCGALIVCVVSCLLDSMEVATPRRRPCRVA
jgi:hypothetical protein